MAFLIKKLKFSFLLISSLFLIVFSIPASATEQKLTSAKLENLCLVIPSCDKYAEVWHPFFSLLVKHWPSFKNKIYLISNGKRYEEVLPKGQTLSELPTQKLNVQTIAIQNEKSWSDNLITALETIPEDYILIMMDDYLITQAVDNEKIAALFSVMKQEQAGFLQLYTAAVENQHAVISELGYLPKNAEYRVSLQAGIWDKKVLKQLLVANESAWDFEIKGSKRSLALDVPFMSLNKNALNTSNAERLPIRYFGAISRGYWVREALDLLKRENIPVNQSLPVTNAFRDWLKGPARDFCSNLFAKPIKRLFGIDNILPVDLC